jgi:hypothetical protein
MKIGYHYTSLENWEIIKKNGIRPYLIDKEEWHHIFPGGVIGVWIWEDELVGSSHVGNILYQVYSKGSPKIAKIKIKYDEDSILPISVSHNGNVGAWSYHHGEKSIISVSGVKPENLSLIKIYDIVKLLK